LLGVAAEWVVRLVSYWRSVTASLIVPVRPMAQRVVLAVLTVSVPLPLVGAYTASTANSAAFSATFAPEGNSVTSAASRSRISRRPGLSAWRATRDLVQ